MYTQSAVGKAGEDQQSCNGGSRVGGSGDSKQDKRHQGQHERRDGDQRDDDGEERQLGQAATRCPPGLARADPTPENGTAHHDGQDPGQEDLRQPGHDPRDGERGESRPQLRDGLVGGDRLVGRELRDVVDEQPQRESLNDLHDHSHERREADHCRGVLPQAGHGAVEQLAHTQRAQRDDTGLHVRPRLVPPPARRGGLAPDRLLRWRRCARLLPPGRRRRRWRLLATRSRPAWAAWCLGHHTPCFAGWQGLSRKSCHAAPPTAPYPSGITFTGHYAQEGPRCQHGVHEGTCPHRRR